MSANKSRKEVKAYRRYYRQKASTRREECEFCTMTAAAPQFVTESKHFKVIRNLFPYSLWDDHAVADHLLLIPKRHIDRLSDLETHEMTEFFLVLGQYEADGYNLYARAPHSIQKSIVHQHTHLLKPAGKRKRLLFFSHKPYVRVSV